MAVAAYASVLSLLRVVDSIQHPSRLRLFPDTAQIDALREKLRFLQDFFELHSSTITEDIECRARKILKITYDSELLIDKYVVEQLYRELYPENKISPRNYVVDPICREIDHQNDVVYATFHDEIGQQIQEIESISEALKTMETIQHDQEKHRVQLGKFAGDKPLKNKMVGFDDQLKQVLEKLTGNQPNLVILPIVGMGGIGKTTLARSLFDHPYNRDHFHVRIWLTISQDYSLKNILRGLLRDDGLGDHEEDRELGRKSESELITQLHQKLFGQRYLIVLDDVWNAEALDDLKRGFPDNGKGSRVIITTRLYDIANYLGSQNYIHSMKFLDEDKSWDLFSEKAFDQGGRSHELEEIGRVISKSCKGLPLLLVLVGGLLADSNMSVEYWQTVKENINSFANSAYDEYCLRILLLSYRQLPIHLKTCFLYMRHTPEDGDIEVSELINEWVSHGFVKPIRGKSLEEAARKYLEDLVGRNMLLVRKRGKNGSNKICGVHDLLRDLSIKESDKEQLLEIPKTVSVSRNFYGQMCIVCHKKETHARTICSKILCFDFMSSDRFQVCSSCESAFPEFARSIFVVAVTYRSQGVPLLTTYRWITLHSYYGISVWHTLRLIWNLEILHIRETEIYLPAELWDMPQLRHVKVGSLTLCDPVSTKNGVIVLENLQTFTKIEQFKLTEDIVRRIPNLRKLGLRYGNFTEEGDKKDWSSFYLQNLARLEKLESLCICCVRMASMDLKVITFPCSLKKLTLEGCKIAWGDLSIVGSSLPNLQVLKLLDESVLGEEWNPIEGEFAKLKYLELMGLDLVHWRADDETPQFPVIETLILRDMDRLEAIPREIGELPSLNSIHLKHCPKNVIDSVRFIVEEQQSNGNEGIVVHVEERNGPTYQIGGVVV